MPFQARPRGADIRPAQMSGAVTATYGIAIMVAPTLLARAAGMLDDTGRINRWAALGIRAVGARDVLSAIWMLSAQPGRPLRAACLMRAAASATDAALLGSLLPTSASRWKCGGLAAAWAAANVVAAIRASESPDVPSAVPAEYGRRHRKPLVASGPYRPDPPYRPESEDGADATG